MKSKEIKKMEAQARQAESNYVKPEKSCVGCRFYKKPKCSYHMIFTGRRNLCDNWESKR